MPRIWILVCTTVGLSQDLTHRWWKAVRGARWSETVRWRHELLLLERFGTAQTLTETVWTPQRCMQVLEWLHQEGRLRRRPCTAIEECLLQNIRQGHWR